MKRKIIFSASLFIVMFYISNRLFEIYRLIPTNIFAKFLFLFSDGLTAIIENPLHFSLFPADLLGSLLVAFLFSLYSLLKVDPKTKKGEEYGSAVWGGKKAIKPFIDRDFKRNIILGKGIYKTLNNYPKNPALSRNNNVLVIGGSGSGKTFFFVTPNLLQFHSSYLITDPKGTLLVDYGNAFKKHGFVVKVFNTSNFKRSQHYNPFKYVRTEQDVLEFVDALIMNTSGDKKANASDSFWEKAEKLLFYAYVGYIVFELPPGQRTFDSLLWLINESATSEQDENFKNHVDLLFDELKEKKPNSFSVRQYQKFKLAPGKTAKDILISCSVRVAPFDIQEVREIMSFDEMALDTYGERKTACFLVISDNNKTFNFLAAILESQMFNSLIRKADNKYGGKLPIHVRCILDEFANIGKIPNFQNLISVLRSREISVNIILQAEAQLRSLYEKDADTIIANCDSYIFLGGKDKETLKGVSEYLGKETIRTYNQGETHGRNQSSSQNSQGVGRELMTIAELNLLGRDECIILLSGVPPFRVKKYNPKNHPEWKAASSCGKFNYAQLVPRRKAGK